MSTQLMGATINGVMNALSSPGLLLKDFPEYKEGEIPEIVKQKKNPVKKFLSISEIKNKDIKRIISSKKYK